MDKKKKIRVVVIVPVIATLVVAGMAIYFMLQVSASAGQGVTYSPQMAEVSEPGMAISNDMPVSNDEVISSDGAPPTVSVDAAPPYEGDHAAPEPLPSTEAECNFNHWVGQPVNEEAVRSTGRPYRILRPDSMVTRDFSPQRINVMIDDRNMVTAVRCG